jgi:hypothetical protein
MMSRSDVTRFRRCALVGVLVLVAGLAAGCNKPSDEPEFPGIDDKAEEILKGMSDRLAKSKTLIIRARRSIDPALLPGRDVVEQGDVTVSICRPDKVTAFVTGPDHEKHFYYDGVTFSLHDVRENAYGAVQFSGDLDGLVGVLEEKLGIMPPLGEFLCRDPYAELTSHTRSGRWVGEESVEGKAVHHLEFTEETVAWDLWVDVADQLPVRLVSRVTSMEGEPKIEVWFDEVVLDPVLDLVLDDVAFTFTPPPGVECLKMVNSESLSTE